MRMNFVSILFCSFAALTILLYYILPQRFQWLVLLVMSMVFYASYGLELLPAVLMTNLIVWYAARKMAAVYDKAEEEIKASGSAPRPLREAAKKRCRRILWAAVTLIVLILVFVKTQRWMSGLPVLSWIPWFISKVYHHLGKLLVKIPGVAFLLKDDIFTDHSRMATTISVLAPLGISYYTFSLISYLADVYWKKDKPEKSYFRLLTFTVYFPKILQGPISRHRELAPQLFEGHAFNYTKFCFGLQRMLWGYFKKLVIADRLAIFVTRVFGNIADETGAHLLVCTVFSVVQLYCDFSGCMDIACGFSECLGLKLAENFDHPFFSQSAA